MSDAIVNVTDSSFETDVLKSDKPVLVDFWAEWCAPCKMMGAVLNDMADEVADKVKIAKVDVDANQQISMKFGIRNIPSIMIFKDGEVQAQTAGAMSKAQLQTFIDQNV